MKQDTMDLYNTEQRLNSVINKIRNSNILRTNKNKIIEFANHCIADNIGKNKTSRYLYDLYNIALWLNKSLQDMNKQDVERILVKLQETHYSEWTKRGYKIILKKFFKWIKGTREYPEEVCWIKTAIRENHKKLPEEILNEEEIRKLLDACTTPRDKAIIAVLYDSGCRVGELLNLKIKDIEPSEYGMKACLMGKTGMRKILLIFSVPYLAEWLNEHPDKQPNSYLWVKRDNDRLSYGRIRDLLSDTARAAKITKKVNPHNFRHSRATYYANKLKESEMKMYFGWNKSETVEIYTHLSGRDIDNSILRSNGIITEQEQQGTSLKPIKCERCKKVNKSTDIFCSICGLPLNEKIRQEITQKDTERAEIDKIMSELVKDKDALKLLVEMIKKKKSA